MVGGTRRLENRTRLRLTASLTGPSCFYDVAHQRRARGDQRLIDMGVEPS